MLLTPEQQQIGKDNFTEVMGIQRREFIKAAAAAGTGLGAAYFGYGALKGRFVPRSSEPVTKATC